MRPYPVTSVAAVAPAPTIASEAMRLRRCHDGDRLSLERGRAQSALDRGRDQAGTKWLRQVQDVAWACSGVGHDVVGVNLAGDRIPKFRLGVVY